MEGVSLFVCLCVCWTVIESWITFDGSWWNFQEQSNTEQIIYRWESQISLPPGYSPGQKRPVSRKPIFSLSLFLQFCDISFGEPKSWAKKNRKLNFDFWGRGQNKWVGTQGKVYFLKIGIFTYKDSPKTNSKSILCYATF